MLTDSKVLAFKPPAKGQQEYSDAKVTGLRLRVGAGGTKTWIFRARIGDRTINKNVGSYPGMDLTEARTAALKLVAAIARGGSTEAVERTFGAVAEHFQSVCEKPRHRNNAAGLPRRSGYHDFRYCSVERCEWRRMRT